MVGNSLEPKFENTWYHIYFNKHKLFIFSDLQSYMQHRMNSLKSTFLASAAHSPSHIPSDRPGSTPAMNSVSPNLSPLSSLKRRLLSDSVTSPHLSSLVNQRPVPGSPVTHNGGEVPKSPHSAPVSNSLPPSWFLQPPPPPPPPPFAPLATSQPMSSTPLPCHSLLDPLVQSSISSSNDLLTHSCLHPLAPTSISQNSPLSPPTACTENVDCFGYGMY